MRESRIVYQNGKFWVWDGNGQYTVYVDGAIAASSDSSYERSADGLSLAIARADYLASKGASVFFLGFRN